MSVESQVLNLLKSKEWISNSEIEDTFPKGTKGHYSWPQRLRGLRDKGYIIKRRIKSGTKNLSEWHLEEPKLPDTPQEEIIRHNNLIQEEKINRQVYEKNNQLAFLR